MCVCVCVCGIGLLEVSHEVREHCANVLEKCPSVAMWQVYFAFNAHALVFYASCAVENKTRTLTLKAPNSLLSVDSRYQENAH